MKSPHTPRTPHSFNARLITLACFLGACLLSFLVVLYNTQIVHGDEYLAKSITSTAKTETVQASRGLLTDRNGKVLVSNRITYTLSFDASVFNSNASTNAAILRLLQLCQSNNITWTDNLPISRTAPFTYLLDTSSESQTAYFTKYTGDREFSISSLSAGQMVDKMRGDFGIDASYSDTDARLILSVRYELAVRKLLDSPDSYVLADGIDVNLISQIADGSYLGAVTGTSSAREYQTTDAAHILGRIGRIWAEEYAELAKQGYSMDALVGKDGVEKAFEQYLHGKDGTRLITTNSEGKTTGELYTKDPEPGNTVALTIDIDLQKAVEDALAKRISEMTAKDGVQRGGGAAVVSVGSGEILALASYPTYNLATFDQDYDKLSSDPALPMFNRATYGTYAPGSTFKPCTAVAALETGIINTNTKIQDKGIYTYYSSPQPTCWIYSSTGGTHGFVNVSQAITVSCNYFFYEVGRLTGIANIDNYASQFGLGKPTGIEIGDSAGSLASPEYAEENGLEWTDGQTLTAAIGQSYNLFTPLQLANYIATLAGGGAHYNAHLLKNVKSYDNSDLVYTYDETPTNTVGISSENLQAVLSGMHDLTTGSLSTYFSNCVVDAAAKTGTAQTGGTNNNGVFVAFAPYDKPQIAVAIVIEKGDAGAALASTAVEILNSYFSKEEIGTAVIGENSLLK
ncbi:MAG: penicillin-binding transpeptidase domain-containing protein [Oscillibacter sp.]|nr:penicillin-binding transpeptidase domain-containing protein [Oscillibacter sp.]